jgi:PTH2 family peptidyl-tRNA hydrolase
MDSSPVDADDEGPIRPEDVKQVIVIRRDLKMRRGKEIAQGAHASSYWLAHLVTATLDPVTRSATVTLDEAAAVWLTSSWRKATVQAHSEEELIDLHQAALARGLRSHLVRDSGLTEFGGVPTLTALAIGPDRSATIDEVTGHLVIY